MNKIFIVFRKGFNILLNVIFFEFCTIKILLSVIVTYIDPLLNWVTSEINNFPPGVFFIHKSDATAATELLIVIGLQEPLVLYTVITTMLRIYSLCWITNCFKLILFVSHVLNP